MKMRMLFYRPAKDGKWIDNAIAGWTRIWNFDCPKKLICSHQEIWLPPINGDFALGTCYTSTMGQIRNKGAKYNGVCERPANEVLYNPKRWFYAEFEICGFDYVILRDFLNSEISANKGYDVSMLLNFFIPVGIGAKDKWICSEFSNHAAKIALSCRCQKQNKEVCEALKDTFSPMRTAKTLNKLGVKFYNLDGSEV